MKQFNFKFAPPSPILSILFALMVSIIAFFPLTLSGQGNCNCSTSTSLTISSSTTIKSLMISGQLPFYSSNIGCISVADGVTLTVNNGYTFIGTNFKMGANSKIIVNAPFRLTLQSNCKLEGCNGMWEGITLDPTTDFINPGGQLDMSNSRIEDAETGVFAQHYSRVRFVSNVFADNNFGLKITGFVPFINFEDPNDFANNTFSAPNGTANAAITFDNAIYFFIGQDFSNPPAIVNTIRQHYYGVDIKNSVGIGIYGVTFTEIHGFYIEDEPVFSDGVCVRNYNSRDINVKYCNMTGILNTPFLQPYFGIATLYCHGKQIYHDNFVRSNLVGISARVLPFAGANLDIQNNTIIARNCVDVNAMTNGPGKSLLANHNTLTYQQFASYGQNLYDKGGLLTTGIGVPYQIYDNTVTFVGTQAYANGISLSSNTGVSEVTDNIINFSGDYSGSGLSMGGSRNCRIYRNTITGTPIGYPFYNSSIWTLNSTNLAFCCNILDGSNFGTRFNGANSDIKFYTTTYGAHDTALYFPPAATLNSQFNTGNNWAGASTSLDAFYDGNLFQAQTNAPFRTAPANINSSKIIPDGWFALTGTDPSCTETSFSCPGITPTGEFTELTAEDLAALTSIGEENEYVLRFQQKRQLYRKLVENPQLVNWNQSVSDFYTAAQSNTVGAFDALDEAFYHLYSLSPSLEQSYNPLTHQLDSLGAELNVVRAEYPTATSEQQETLLEQAHELADQIADVQNQVNALLPTVEGEMQTQLTQLLAQNSAINATEIWEVNEKNINDLYFRHYGGLIDTFTAAQKSFIETLALSCPQYEGVGVYKARRLYELFAETTPVYQEHHCKPSEERSQSVQAIGQLTVMPNPAHEQLLVNFGQTLPEGSKLVISDVTGKVMFSRGVSGMSETSLDVSGMQSGIYLIALRPSGLAPLPIKAVISH